VQKFNSLRPAMRSLLQQFANVTAEGRLTDYVNDILSVQPS